MKSLVSCKVESSFCDEHTIHESSFDVVSLILNKHLTKIKFLLINKTVPESKTWYSMLVNFRVILPIPNSMIFPPRYDSSKYFFIPSAMTAPSMPHTSST